MFLGFANFYEKFIKSFSKIVALFTLILKKTLSTSTRSIYIKVNENKLDINSDDGSNRVSSGKINDEITNLSNNIKKMSSRVGFLIFQVSLTFI